MAPTHTVLNQVPPYRPTDLLLTDGGLTTGIAHHGGPAVVAGRADLGRFAGSEEAEIAGDQANRYPPVLQTHDRYGHRIDEVTFHPAWHTLMRTSVGAGLHATPWVSEHRHAHLRRAAGFFLASQVEAGHGCPISMTYAIWPALQHDPELAAAYGPGLASTDYTPGLTDPLTKPGLLAGMGMTEKQGGSDVRANTTRAVPQADGSFRLTGHKWFCSAPMCDLFLVLAQVERAGLSCFLVPRILPAGDRNAFAIQRLKDKLGNRSNASAEVELDGTVGWLIGPAGQGVRTILDMVTLTRLDCVIGSAAGQRAAYALARHHAEHRWAFGARLVDQPVMRSVLADLALESEAATATFLRLAAAVDSGEQAFLRVAVAAAKFWVCKRSPAVVGEALECLGGNGYVEESGMPRLFRESPLNSIWEGSGNVIALDVLRALGRDPAAAPALLAELATARGIDDRYDTALVALERTLAAVPEPGAARRVAADLALLLQASLLLRTAPGVVADVFCATRLGEQPYGVLGSGLRGRQADSVLALR
ncbi:MAG TPA: acyl-CoA dehydrogenase family protein [Microlunatus sp.]|nr:acyl-CoA dehydrogenase family protein [Microlunatus sp.]